MLKNKKEIITRWSLPRLSETLLNYSLKHATPFCSAVLIGHLRLWQRLLGADLIRKALLLIMLKYDRYKWIAELLEKYEIVRKYKKTVIILWIYVIPSDDPEPSWLEPCSARLGSWPFCFSSDLFFSARKLLFFATQRKKTFQYYVLWKKRGLLTSKKVLRIHTIKTPLIIQISISTYFYGSQKLYY